MIELGVVPLSIAVLVWFALSFVTRTWLRQWIAAVLAGLSTAWWQYGTMLDVAETAGIAPMPVVQFALISVAGMLILASAGMGLYWLLQRSRGRG
ncbi:hypothetical protein [Sinisalibacter aestuarii]|uniref:Uncharacterized protein n=1 Tax=Sinisalibacter aestuarii TaxID=2949426 RepID=A0ABQ5LWD6_9RHOB|nr:hypothetical protein [Sinisalibacter aestuarii]GKY88417.1 hypothetical protein STA1M1_22860 [Sinisalibacter aestuarii]